MKKDIEKEINEFLMYFDSESIISFLESILPLFELYDVEDQSDWVENEVGKENERNVRLLRTVYLLSKIAELHGGKLACIKVHFPSLFILIGSFLQTNG
jgi:L-fucose mutarotase/ribose pyranase (RbsD/FucU family)